jgi:tetratricopeptide (TPR) repeat protein
MAEGAPINKQSILENAVFPPGATVKIDSIEQKQVIYQAPLPKRPGEPFAHNIPRSGVGAFVGRSEEMTQLRKALQEARQGSIVALKGMGGVGKTELAIRYAHQYLNPEYPAGVCWVTGSVGDIGDQLIQFAVTRLGLTVPKEELPDLKAQVDFCWHNWPLSGQALVIVDDLRKYADLKPYLPPEKSRFKILVTTRKSFGKPVQNVELDVLEAESALELLKSVIGAERQEKELDSARRLCGDILGNLPLGIELVGRYLERNKKVSLEKICERLEKKKLEHTALKKTDEEPTTAELGVAAAFELSWVELSSAAQNLGTLLSLFALSPIPWGLVEAIQAERTPEQYTCEQEEALREAQEELRLLHLVREPFESWYLLHTLIRDYFGEKLKESEWAEGLKRRYCRVMVKGAKGFPDRPTRQQWEEFAYEMPHLIEVPNRLLYCVEDNELVLLFLGIALFYDGQGIYAQAELWYERGLKECIARLGSEHIAIIILLNNLAELYRVQGQYEQAELRFVNVLKMSRKLLGQEHPSIAGYLNNLAGVYFCQGRYKEAEPLFVQALEMSKKLFGEEHSLVADSLNNLAVFYSSLGRYAEAKPLSVQALRLRKCLWGDEHPLVVTSLNNIGVLCIYQEQYEEAEPLLVEALAMGKRLLGDEHLDVATSLNSLAGVYYSQDRLEQAEPLFLQAWDLRKHLLGEEHPDVADSLNSLAELYQCQGKYEQAEPLYVQAFEILDRRLGFTHPNTQMVWDNYMQFLEMLLKERPPALEVLRVSGSAMTREMLQ